MKADRIEKINEQIESGFSSEYGFLHVGKTGGSGISALRKKLLKSSYHPPLHFGHSWRINEVFAEFPEVKISCIIRDPLIRIISGFNSRLRQGRPTRNNIWSPAEAAAFSFFKSPTELLRAAMSDDDHEKSAAAYAFERIQHLKFDYEHYFVSVDEIMKNEERFYFVGDIGDMDACLRGIFMPCDIPESDLEEHYKKTHVAETPSKNYLSDFSEEEIERLKAIFAKEYDIYNCLKAFVK
jgi:hypothetical protein